MTVMDFPRQHEKFPLLPLETVHHFLSHWRGSKTYVLLMHCERGGWPVLAFMLAGLLLYRGQYSGEQKTLEMIYSQAPPDLLCSLSALNPYPSQLRYLQYISRRNYGGDWPPSDRPLILVCLMLRSIPLFEGGNGCRPVVRVYTAELMSREYLLREYQCVVVRVDVRCRVQGDVVIECVHIGEIIFRVMFHTAFVRRKVLMVSRDDVDIMWDAKDRFSGDFRAEVLFADADAILPPPPPPPASAFQ